VEVSMIQGAFDLMAMTFNYGMEQKNNAVCMPRVAFVPV
jgi:hypothetical protein